MTKLKGVYKCEICGNIIEVLDAGGGKLVCCGDEMILQKENVVDASGEKHVPQISVQDDVLQVKVGEVDHPMTDDHYIQWIEVQLPNEILIKFLKAGQKPEAKFFLN